MIMNPNKGSSSSSNTSNTVTVTGTGNAVTSGVFDESGHSLTLNKDESFVTQESFNNAISGITQIDYQVVSSLPATGTKGIIYMVPKSETDDNDEYDEYIWNDTKFEKIGGSSKTVTDITGNAATATALATARTIQTNLASTTSASFDGTANITPGVTGTLPIANGGTGQTTGPLAQYALTNASSTLTSTTLATGDYVPIADVSAATGKKITVANLTTYLGNNITVSSATTATTANALTTAQTIDGVSFDGSASIIHYGTCSTTSSTAAKVVACTGFTLVTGARIAVRFTYTNTSSAPTLNVNSTGAIAITMYGTTAPPTYYWYPNTLVEFVYDGTSWLMNKGYYASTTYYGPTKLSSSVSSTSTLLAATPYAVKQAYDLATSVNTSLSSLPQIEVGTYVGNGSTTAAQAVPVAFTPKFVWVGLLDVISYGKAWAPWSYYSDDDADDYTYRAAYLYSGYAYYGTPMLDYENVEVLTVTDSGFSAFYTVYKYENTAKTSGRYILIDLNCENWTYFYLAIG